MNLLIPNMTSEAVNIPDVLKPHECNSIISCLSDLEPTPAGVGVENFSRKDEKIRNSKIIWIPYGTKESEKYEWIYENVTKMISQINQTHFKFDLTAFGNIQYTIYDGNESSSYYTSHRDTMIEYTSVRKLSFTIQLSDPSEYEGGELQLYDNSVDTPFIVPKSQGMVTAFPSYVLHEVTPVTKGIRKSLVVWVVGPAFK